MLVTAEGPAERRAPPDPRPSPATARPRPERTASVRDAAAASDAAVVAALGDGDGDALAEIYDRYGGAVWAVATRVCGDRTLAEDVTQTVFVELWRRPRRYDPERGALRPWLMAQAHARAVDAVRSEAARRRREEREAGYPVVPPPDVETEVHLATLSDGVRRAVARLASDERDAIVLAYFGGHSYREAAEMLGAPEGTVKSRIRRGLSGLRRALESEGMTS